MCEQCQARINSWGEVMPNFSLGRATVDGYLVKRGQWTLTKINDPDFWFTCTPRPYPLGWPSWLVAPRREELSPEDEAALLAWENETEVFYNEIRESLVACYGEATRLPDLGSWSRLLLAAMHLNAPARVLSFDDYEERDKYNFPTKTSFTTSYFVEWLFHYLGRVIEDNPEPVYRSYDDDGTDPLMLNELLQKLGVSSHLYRVVWQAENEDLDGVRGHFLIQRYVEPFVTEHLVRLAACYLKDAPKADTVMKISADFYHEKFEIIEKHSSFVALKDLACAIAEILESQ